jgi:hypothetical protein
MIATFTALVIGLLVASAKTSFDNKDGTIKRVASQAVLLDHMLAECGPEKREAREFLRQGVATTIRQLWPTEGAGKIDPDAIGRTQGIEASRKRVLRLSPQNDEQKWLKLTALQVYHDVATA